MMVVWFTCFIIVYKGVKLSSWVVWVTVPLPLVFVFIMVLNGLTLDNCDIGFKMYLKGMKDGVAPDVGEKLAQPAMWSEACAQIFFSLGVCMGIMIPYSSYNPTNAPIVKNAFTVALCNCSFSFFAGFGVFSIVGYLQGMGSIVADKVSGLGLAFVAYPAALETLPGANFWTLMFSLTLFTLGIDSSFSIVESVATVLGDTIIGEKLSKGKIAMILGLVGAIGSTLFCFNWGFTLFDIVDHYLNVYLVLFMGVLESLGAAWVHCWDDALQKGQRISVHILVAGYWILLNTMPWPAYYGYVENSYASIPAFWGGMIIVWIVSFLTSKLKFVEWYQNHFFYGVRPIS